MRYVLKYTALFHGLSLWNLREHLDVLVCMEVGRNGPYSGEELRHLAVQSEPFDVVNCVQSCVSVTHSVK